MLKVITVLACVSLLAACGPIPRSSAPAPSGTQGGAVAPVLPAAAGLVKLDNPNFTVYYSSQRNTPAIVVEALTAQSVSQKVSRIDEFSTDTRVQTYGTQAYSRTGYDRGHMAAAANQTAQSMAASNLLSNIVPQTPESNRQSWRELEELTRSIVERQAGTTYVISGTIGELSKFPIQYGDPYLQQPTRSGASVQEAIYPKSLLAANIAIPAYLYKIRVYQGQIQDVSVTANCKPENSRIKGPALESYCYTKNLGITSYGSDLPKFLKDYSAWDASYAPAFTELQQVINALPRG